MLKLPNRKADVPSFPEWHLQAACYETDVSVFIPPDNGGEIWEHKNIASVRSLFCDGCSVAVQCLDSALRNGDVGIWAGTTTYQRKQIRRKRDRVKCPVCENRKLIDLDSHWLCLACGVSWNGETSSEAETKQEN